jgi:hypothetical protein
MLQDEEFLLSGKSKMDAPTWLSPASAATFDFRE